MPDRDIVLAAIEAHRRSCTFKEIVSLARMEPWGCTETWAKEWLDSGIADGLVLHTPIEGDYPDRYRLTTKGRFALWGLS